MKNIYQFFALFLVFFSTSLYGQEGILTKQAPLPCLDKKFTIVAHVVRDTFADPGITEAEIQQGIDSLNLAFSPICASFEICEFRYIDNFQYDLINGNDWEEMQIKYNQDNRINMYFVTDTDDENAICGFATLGGITMFESGGIVIKKVCVFPESKTIPHEMGHYFGLLHTFEGSGNELVNGNNCDTAGDIICDTPADPYEVGDPIVNYVDVSQGCRFISNKVDANGEFYVPDVGNIMSYYPNECRCGFTYEQFLHMANTYLSSPGMW